MCNWSFFRLPFCVSFLTFHGVCETVSHFSSSSSSSSRSKTVHSISLKPPAQRVDGTGGGEGVRSCSNLVELRILFGWGVGILGA